MEKMNSAYVKKQLRLLDKHQWQLARVIGVSPGTLTTWLRTPVEGERCRRVEAALTALEGGGGGC